MHFEWIVNPVVQYGLQALGLGLCLYLFFALKCEARSAEIRTTKAQQALASSLGELRAAVDAIESRLHEAEERSGVLVAPQPPPSGLNLSKRSQALRMYRRGEAPQKIAGSLSLPVKEVELLVKVHQIALEQT
jgi:hypothetical protein